MLVLYAFSTRPDGSGGQGCLPYFGQIDGDTLIVTLGRRMQATYTFEESGRRLWNGPGSIGVARSKS